MRPDSDLPSASEISDLVEQAFSTLDGLEARPCAPFEPALDDASWTGLVSMGGGFDGAITLHCPRRLVQRVASAMLGAADEDISDEAAGDAFGELTHIVAGNIKSLIAVPAGAAACALTGRRVQSGVQGVPRANSRREVYFSCGEDHFWLRLWEAGEPR